MLRRVIVVAPPLALMTALAGCVQASDLPGTSLGTWSVAAKLSTNTCGANLGAENPWDFTADLSKDDSTLYLEDTSTSDQVSGVVDSTNGTTATLISAVTSNVDGVNGATGPCNLTLSSSYAVTLDDATAPKNFTGTATFTYAGATGVSSTNDCTDQLSSNGGKYDTLPCTVTYTLSATKN